MWNFSQACSIGSHLYFCPEELSYRFWICQYTPQIKQSSINQLLVDLLISLPPPSPFPSPSLPSTSLLLPFSIYMCACSHYKKHKYQRFYKWLRVDNKRKGLFILSKRQLQYLLKAGRSCSSWSCLGLLSSPTFPKGAIPLLHMVPGAWRQDMLYAIHFPTDLLMIWFLVLPVWYNLDSLLIA